MKKEKILDIQYYKNFLKENGYIHVEDFFTDTEVAKLRIFLEEKEKNNEKNEIHDVLSVDQINSVFLCDKYLSFISKLLGNNLYYFGASTMRFHQNDVDVFHVDSRNDINLNYKDEYPIYRMALYLQDHDNWSGGIKIRIKSHRKICIRLFPYSQLIQTLKRIYKYKSQVLNFIFPGKIKNIRSKKNDLILWNMRTHHSGRFKLLKFFSSLNLHPFFEKYLPEFFFKKYQMKRYALYIAFGRDEGVFLNDYVEDYAKKRHKEELKNYNINSKKYAGDLKRHGIGLK